MGSGKPLELVLGKKFKMEVWEAVLQKMAINEVAQYTVSKNVGINFSTVDLFTCKSRYKNIT